MCVLSGRRLDGRGCGGHRPAVGHRSLPAPRPPPRRADRARARDPQPRRPRLRSRAARGGDGGDDPRPPPGRRRIPTLRVRGRLAPEPRQGRDRGGAHRRPSPRAHVVPAPRHQPWRRTDRGADRRLAVRRRRRPPRPRDRAPRGRCAALPVTSRAPPDAARERRGVAGTPRGIDVRRLDARSQGLLDDRLRGSAQPRRGLRLRAGLRRRRSGRARGAPAPHRARRRPQSWTADRGSGPGTDPARSTGGRDGSCRGCDAS